MSGSKFVAECLPCLFTPQELAALRSFDNDSSSPSSLTNLKAITDYKTSHGHLQHSSGSCSNTTNNEKRKPRLNYLINWNLLTFSSLFRLRKTFVQCNLDDETKNWILLKSSPSAAKQMVSDLLHQFFGRTSANGLTFRGEMFVLSRNQFNKLLEKRRRGEFDKEENEQQREREGIEHEERIARVENVTSSSSSLSSSSAILSRYHRTCSVVAELGGRSGGDITDENNDEHNGTLQQQQQQQQQREAVRHLIRRGISSSSSPQRLSILDIGAGDGGVTKNAFAPFFDDIFTTEDNPVMRLRLKASFGWNNCFSSYETSDVLRRGCSFSTTATTSISENERELRQQLHRCFDSIALLNVLDRCDKPLTLLKEIREHLIKSHEQQRDNPSSPSSSPSSSKPFLILAVVLPWCPFVERGNQQVQPSETLMMQGGGFCKEGATFESSLEKMVTNVLVPSGFKVCAWTRVPYICEGDARNEYYCLDDALFLLEAA